MLSATVAHHMMKREPVPTELCVYHEPAQVVVGLRVDQRCISCDGAAL